MLDWHASAGDCTYTFRAVYMPWLALAWLVAVGSFFVFVRNVLRWRRQRSPLHMMGLALLTMAVTLAGCGAATVGERDRANVLFSFLFDASVVALVSGFVILVVSLIMTIVYIVWRGPRLVAGFVALVMSLPTMGLATAQLVDLGRERLPRLGMRSPVGFHVGQTRHVKPNLYWLAELGEKDWFETPAWTLDEVVFEAAAPGVVERAATARSGRFTVLAKVKAKAHRAEGNPYLPLQVGNEWHYELTKTTKYGGTRYLLFFKSNASTEMTTARIVLAIEPAPPRDGWREYSLVMKTAQGGKIREHGVRPIDGETYFYDRTWTPPDEPNPAETDMRKALKVLLTVDPGPTPERECRLADVGEGRCQMGGAQEDVLPPLGDEPATKQASTKNQGDGRAMPVLVPARVPTQYALAGPSRLAATWKSGGTLGSFINIVTFGSVSPGDLSGAEEYVLMRTTRGKDVPRGPF